MVYRGKADPKATYLIENSYASSLGLKAFLVLF